jgi:threonine/homoserine/homoserine lactone efflux protein
MGVGGVAFAVAALLGLQALLAAVPTLYVALKLLGGAYLAYLGVRLWQGAGKDLSESGLEVDGTGPRRAFWLGLATQLSNPKTAVVYASVFAAFMPRAVPGWFLLLLPVVVFAIETAWYALVAVALSAAGPRATYLRSKAWIDRAAGTAMGLLGVKLIVDFRGG